MSGKGFFMTAGGILFFIAMMGFSGVAATSPNVDNKIQTKAPAPLNAKGYDYSFKGKSDPFKPFMETDLSVIQKKKEEALKRQKAAALKKEGPISPLQKADITHFQLVGIAIDENAKTAIVEDKTAKKHYPVFVGTYIGLHGGRVAEILADRLIVEEISKSDDNKKKQVKRIEVFLHKEQP